MMYSLLRPFLFKFDEEKAHQMACSALKYLPKFCFFKPQYNPVNALGLDFQHPIGLAAGLDKNADYLDALAKLGFSFIEVGTVTPKPQLGNPQPRLFRIPERQAIVNRMGFNNKGVDSLIASIKKAQYKGILGINIGKNRDTSLNNAVEDYLMCMRAVYPYASYITINISSPNTPDLRELQKRDYFSSLLKQLRAEQQQLENTHQNHVPLVVKLSPDESEETLKEMTQSMLAYGIEGIIASNTTSNQEYFSELPPLMKQGGLSGVPLQNQATACLRLLKSYVGNEISLIGVGGVHNVASAQEKIDSGASLIQLYTGLIYQGPGLISQLANHLDLNK